MSVLESFRSWRHQLNLARLRAALRPTDFKSGLGQSVHALSGLVRSLRPSVVVEIGSARGWSACHIGLALRENVHGKLYAIDPHHDTAWNDDGSRGETSLAVLRRNVRRLALDPDVEIVRADSRTAATNWTHPIDLLFIDGDHSYAGVKADWHLFSPHLTEFGVAVFHDTTWEYHRDSAYYREDMGVPRFVDELRRAGYPVLTLDRDYGLSLVQKRVGGIPLLRGDAKGAIA